MVSLDISGKNQEIPDNKSEDNNQIIYDFSSEEASENENENPHFVKIEEHGETSGTKRPADFEKEFTKQKFQKVPHYYEPSQNPFQGQGVLDIDCSLDTAKDLRDWYNTNNVLIHLNEDLRNLGSADIFNYLQYKTRGNAFKYISNLPPQVIGTMPLIGSLVTDWVYSLLVKEFKGWKDTVQSKAAFSDQNLWKITNLKICNMCYIDNFICEFQSYYYNIDNETRLSRGLLDLFYDKLPEGVSTQVKLYFTSTSSEGKVDDTLGGRITVLKQWLTDKCSEKIAKREAKVSLCCDKLQNKVGNYRCNSRNPKKKSRRNIRSYKKKKFRKIPFKKFRKGDKKFFRKKPPYPKRKTCPQNKKSCTCWLCHEEGHYANECPKRDNPKKNVLQAIYAIGYEPIESDVESDEEIYEYCTETDSEIDLDVEESTW
ncbi:unnamed protein product [Trifolium pratense]|uniref:Uncharacterized protein n=1 Tax=Trifolium pratense TaxID=57577 RepID=A0ACB0L9H1_TRIPR|nr:unnamed protein product [Trifolium pratense]